MNKALRRSIVGVVVLVPLLLLSPSLLGQRVFHATDLLERHAPWSQAPPDASVSNPLVSDTVDGAVPGRDLFTERMRDGEAAPLWNGFVLGGRPLALIPNEGFYSPLNIASFVLPIWYSLGWTKVFEMAAAIGLMYLFLRRLGLSVAASAVGGLVYAFSGFQVAWTNWPQAHIGALIPGLFWGVEVAIDGRGPRSAAPLALVTAVMWLEGFPAVTVYAMLFAGGYALVRLAASEGRRSRLRRGWRTLSGVGLGTGVAAFQLIPFVLWIQQIDIGAREQNPGWTLARRTLATLAVPDAFGNPVDHNYYGPADYFIYGPVNYVENQAFLGIAALAMVGLAAVYGRRLLDAGRFWFLWSGVAVCLVLIYWGGPPLEAVQSLPLIGTNHIGRLRAVMLFILAVLAALGFEAIVRHATLEPGRRRWILLVAFGIIGVVVGSGLVRAGEMAAAAGESGYLRSELVVAGLLSSVVLVSVALGHRRRTVPVAAGALTLVVALEVVLFAAPWWPQVKTELFYPETATHRFLGETLGGDRIAVTGQTMLPSTSVLYRIRSVTAHVFPDPAWKEALLAVDPGAFRLSETYSSLAHDPSIVTSPLLDRMAARFVVTDPGYQVLGPRVAAEEVSDQQTLGAGESLPFEWVEGTRAVTIFLPVGHQPGTQAEEITVEIFGPDGEQAVGRRRIPRALGSGTMDLAVPAPIGWTPTGARVAVAGDTPVTVGVAADGSPVVGRVLDAADGLVVVFADDTVIYERLGGLPRIRWASHSTVVADAGERLAALSGPVEADTVVLSDQGGDEGGDADLRVLRDDGGDQLAVRVAATGPGYLVIADSMQDGWVFRVDGEPVRPIPADHVGVAIPVAEGTHVVEAVFLPPGRDLGLFITTLSLTVLVLVALTVRVHHRDDPGGA